MLSSISSFGKKTNGRNSGSGKTGKKQSARRKAPWKTLKKGGASAKKRNGRERVQGAEGNNILIHDSVEVRPGKIKIIKTNNKARKGIGNTVEIRENAKAIKAEIVINGNNNRVLLDEGCEFTGRILVKGDNQTVSLGRHTTTAGVYILCSEGCNVIIGDYCMFSRKIEIRTTDAHSVIDRKTGNRVNGAQSIAIGNHVWVGVGAIINKGSAIADDCIVGALSFVNKQFLEESVVIAGTPAKVVKRDISWNRKSLPHFRPAEIDAWRHERSKAAGASAQPDE